MTSKLIVTSVASLQSEIIRISNSLRGVPGIYVSLNRPPAIVENELNQRNVDVSKFFFIDCVSEKAENDLVLSIRPNDLEKLEEAIKDFIIEIPNEKFLLIDALSTLLIYNSEESVVAFMKNIVDFAAEKEVIVVAVSPHTKGENLLDKIYNFFDEVVETEKTNKEEKDKHGEDLVY